MFEGIHHVAIICCDYEKLKIFYTKILGLDVIAENYRADRESYKLDWHWQTAINWKFFHSPMLPADYLQSCGVEVEPIRLDEYTGRKFTFFQDPDVLPLEIYEH